MITSVMVFLKIEEELSNPSDEPKNTVPSTPKLHSDPRHGPSRSAEPDWTLLALFHTHTEQTPFCWVHTTDSITARGRIL